MKLSLLVQAWRDDATTLRKEHNDSTASLYGASVLLGCAKDLETALAASEGQPDYEPITEESNRALSAKMDALEFPKPTERR